MTARDNRELASLAGLELDEHFTMVRRHIALVTTFRRLRLELMRAQAAGGLTADEIADLLSEHMIPEVSP